jgi:pimeloyl-ACP methyl ester carboxylesterase
MAAQFPERVNHLVMVGAPALSDIPMPRTQLKNWQRIEAGAKRDEIHRFNLAALMFANPALIDKLAVRLHEQNIGRDRLRSRSLQRTDIVVRTLPRVTCRVTGIWGEKDAVYFDRIHTIEPALKSALNYQKLTLLPEVGHWAQYEAADLFNPVLLDALSLRDAS